MTNILILGANGQIARVAIDLFLKHTNARLTLYLRLIEPSGLDYTILRPAWLNDRDEIDYATTPKGEPFKNPFEQVSRKSVADLVVKLAMTLTLEIRSSLGVHRAS